MLVFEKGRVLMCGILTFLQGEIQESEIVNLKCLKIIIKTPSI